MMKHTSYSKIINLTMDGKDWNFKLASQQTINSLPPQHFIVVNFIYTEQSKKFVNTNILTFNT